MNQIIEVAGQIHQRHWKMTGNASHGTKLAQQVNREWQEALRRNDSGINIRFEVQISASLKQRIDIVDDDDHTAYELKVSPNNGHFEFYKDIFKILIYNKNNEHKLKRLVFITPLAASEKLKRGLGKESVDVVKEYGIAVKIVGI